MQEYFGSASAATCAAMAQILPVFLVALVAERVVRTRAKSDPMERAQAWAQMTVRISLDFATMIVIIALTMSALLGIERDGVTGREAQFLWWGTFIVAVVIAQRWLMFSTPVITGLNRLAAAYGALVIRAMDALLVVLPRSFEWIALVAARVLQVIGEITIAVLSTGLSRGIEVLSDWLARVTAVRDSTDAPEGAIKKD